MPLLYGLGWVPVVFVTISLATFVITYTIAVVKKDAQAIFPYISDTGTHPPESCIFGQFLNIASIFALLVVYIRYKHISVLLTGNRSSWLKWLNWLTLVIGFSAGLGMSIVGNFQESAVLTVHLIGAGMIFYGGTLYGVATVVQTFSMKITGKRYVTYIRVVLVTLSVILLIVGTVSTMWYHREVSKFNLKVALLEKTGRVYLTSTSKNGVYSTDTLKDKVYFTSTSSEWGITLVFLLFFLTFTFDFRKISLNLKFSVAPGEPDNEAIYMEDACQPLYIENSSD